MERAGGGHACSAAGTFLHALLTFSCVTIESFENLNTVPEYRSYGCTICTFI